MQCALCTVHILASFVSIHLGHTISLHILSIVVGSNRFLVAFSTALFNDNGNDANPEHEQREEERRKKKVFQRKKTVGKDISFRIDAILSAEKRFLFEIIIIILLLMHALCGCVCVCECVYSSMYVAVGVCMFEFVRMMHTIY